jgi:hypothetical protein
MLNFILLIAISFAIISAMVYYNHLVQGEQFLVSESTNQTIDGYMTTAKFLSIQSAQSGSITRINDTAYALELDNVSDKTILFSDRPYRIVTTIGTNEFIGNWSVGDDSFSEDSPNAIMVVDDIQGQDTSTMILFDPVYDENKKTLRYEVTPDNATSIELPKDLGKSTLIIDAHPTAINDQITD